MRGLAALAIAVLTATNVCAEASDAKKATGCFATAISQYDMNVCTGQAFKKADAALNALYRQMMSRYEPADQALLKDSERKWLAYRDAECAFESNSTAGGDFHLTSEGMCWTEKTQAHIRELKAQFNCPEGDLGCNRPSK